MNNTPTPTFENAPEQSTIEWILQQTRYGLQRTFMGTLKLLGTTVGGVIGASGTIVGGALDGTSRGIREALGGAPRSGPQGALQGA